MISASCARPNVGSRWVGWDSYVCRLPGAWSDRPLGEPPAGVFGEGDPPRRWVEEVPPSDVGLDCSLMPPGVPCCGHAVGTTSLSARHPRLRSDRDLSPELVIRHEYSSIKIAVQPAFGQVGQLAAIFATCLFVGALLCRQHSAYAVCITSLRGPDHDRARPVHLRRVQQR